MSKVVVVLGLSYAGCRAARLLAEGLPPSWKVVGVDRNTHANHVYVFPRYAVLPGHEYKAFIPYTNVFHLDKLEKDKPHPETEYIQAHVIKLYPDRVVLSKRSGHDSSSNSIPEGDDIQTISFDYLIYALGATLPKPLNLWGAVPEDLYLDPERRKPKSPPSEPQTPFDGSKPVSIGWLKRNQAVVQASENIVVVGGGALGIQFATDIKYLHPEKHVTLIHSRAQLLPRFMVEMSDEAINALKTAHVNLILEDRVDLSAYYAAFSSPGGKTPTIRTEKGKVIDADIVLMCTGQSPNTSFLRDMDSTTVSEKTHLAKVLRTMQLVPMSQANEIHNGDLEAAVGLLSLQEKENQGKAESSTSSTPYPHIFAVGDSADAFGAIAAGHTAYYQAEVAARNIVRLVEHSERETINGSAGKVELEHYTPGPPGIKVTLGLRKYIIEMNGQITSGDDGVDDLHAAVVWPAYGIDVEKESDMYP